MIQFNSVCLYILPNYNNIHFNEHAFSQHDLLFLITSIFKFFATTMATMKRFKTGLQKPVGDITVDASIFTTVHDLKSFSSAVGKSHFKALLLSCTGPFQRITWLSSANACWP